MQVLPGPTVVVVGGRADEVAALSATLRAAELSVTGLVSRPGTSSGSELPRAAVHSFDLALVWAPVNDSVTRIVRELRGHGVAKVVVISNEDAVNGDALLAAFVAGADGWLPTSLSADVLGRTLRAVHAGEAAVSRRHAGLLLEAIRVLHASNEHPPDARMALLTKREQDVFVGMAHHESAEAIARRLKISEVTVRWHKARLLRKLALHANEEAAVDQALRRSHPAERDADPTPASPSAAQPPAVEALRPGESRVAWLVAEGMTNQQIAAQLSLSTHTVASHLKSVFNRLGVRSRVELARTLLQQRFEPPATSPPGRDAVPQSGEVP